MGFQAFGYQSAVYDAHGVPDCRINLLYALLQIGNRAACLLGSLPCHEMVGECVNHFVVVHDLGECSNNNVLDPLLGNALFLALLRPAAIADVVRVHRAGLARAAVSGHWFTTFSAK